MISNLIEKFMLLQKCLRPVHQLSRYSYKHKFKILNCDEFYRFRLKFHTQKKNQLLFWDRECKQPASEIKKPNYWWGINLKLGFFLSCWYDVNYETSLYMWLQYESYITTSSFFLTAYVNVFFFNVIGTF